MNARYYEIHDNRRWLNFWNRQCHDSDEQRQLQEATYDYGAYRCPSFRWY
jgi:hypothetical protein